MRWEMSLRCVVKYEFVTILSRPCIDPHMMRTEQSQYTSQIAGRNLSRGSVVGCLSIVVQEARDSAFDSRGLIRHSVERTMLCIHIPAR